MARPYVRSCRSKLLGCGCWRHTVCLSNVAPAPLISWLLSPADLWPGADRRSAQTPAPRPRCQAAPPSPWWPRSGHRAARRWSRRCCCCCSACASGSLLQGAPGPPACSRPAACAPAAPPAVASPRAAAAPPPPTRAGVRWADVAVRWTWTTAVEHIGCVLITPVIPDK